MKVVKSISFNDNNEKEAQMLKIFKRRSFSKYVKQLILADMEKKESSSGTKLNQVDQPTKPQPVKRVKQKNNSPSPYVPKLKSQNGGIKFDFTKGGM